MHQLVIKEGSVLLMHGVTMKFRLFDVCALCTGKFAVLTVPMLGFGSVADKQAVMESMFSVCSVMSKEKALFTEGL